MEKRACSGTSAGTRKDEKQDEEITRQAIKNEELEKLIKELQKANKDRKLEIEKLEKTCEEFSKEIDSSKNKLKDMEDNVGRQLDLMATKKANYISYAIGLAALFVAVIQFFI